MVESTDDIKPEAPFQFGGKEDGMNPMLLGSVGILLSFLLLIIGWLVKAQWEEAASRRRTAAILAMAEADGEEERRGANVAGGRRRNVHRRVNHGEQGGDFMDHMLQQQDGSEDEDAGFSGLPVEHEDGIGTKKLRKLQMKAEKKAMNEQAAIEREERKKREKEKEEKLDEQRARERMEEEAEEERLKKEKEEREKRELEEYLKLKESFAVDEEGYDELEGEAAENLMQKFVDYVKDSKVVNMDELGAHFGLKTEEAVNRLTHFIEEGQLTGVMDDRGKFIYITPEELQAVAKFVNQRGRITITELAECSNRLIRLEAEEKPVEASA